MDSNNSDSTLFNEQEQIVQVFNYSDKKIYITQKDIHLMAQIVYAESNCEPFEGKVAVASVILNRLKYPEFPKTIEGVVKQRGAFSCVRNGNIDVVPDEDSYKAVLVALKGEDPTEKAIFFYNPKIATSQWMKNIGKKNVKTIGNHVFFVVN
jgi:N-acetylmuramoyl-L-alanine amidase